MSDLRKFAQLLQQKLGLVDMLSQRSRQSSGFFELLVIKRDELKIKMYQESGHALPHIHIDYGEFKHTASYSIAPAARLVGELSRKYDRTVISWLGENKEGLLALWNCLQSGEDTEALVATLRGDV